MAHTPQQPALEIHPMHGRDFKNQKDADLGRRAAKVRLSLFGAAQRTWQIPARDCRLIR